MLGRPLFRVYGSELFFPMRAPLLDVALVGEVAVLDRDEHLTFPFVTRCNLDLTHPGGCGRRFWWLQVDSPEGAFLGSGAAGFRSRVSAVLRA